MRHHTIESNNPHTCDYLTGLPDSPQAEIQAAAAEQAQIHAEQLERAADAKHLAAIHPNATAVVKCECGLAGSGASEVLWIRSPRTGRNALVNQQFADELPPRVRGRIARSTGTQEFSLYELTRFHAVSVAHAPPKFTPHVHKGRRW